MKKFKYVPHFFLNVSQMKYLLCPDLLTLDSICLTPEN